MVHLNLSFFTAERHVKRLCLGDSGYSRLQCIEAVTNRLKAIELRLRTCVIDHGGKLTNIGTNIDDSTDVIALQESPFLRPNLLLRFLLGITKVANEPHVEPKSTKSSFGESLQIQISNAAW